MSTNQLPVHFEEINESIYAGFWTRLGSILLDMIILVPINMGLAYLGGLDQSFYTGMMFAQLVLVLFFNVWLVWKYGGTPGKLIVGIKIIQINGTDVTRREAQLRYIVDFILVIFSMFVSHGALMALTNEEFTNMSFLEQGQYIADANPTMFKMEMWLTNIWVWGELIVLLTNDRKRAIHDFIAGTVVIKSKYHNKVKELIENAGL